MRESIVMINMRILDIVSRNQYHLQKNVVTIIDLVHNDVER